MRRWITLGSVLALLMPSAGADWTHYGGDEGGQRHVPATGITPENVNRLAPAWRFSSGDLGRRPAAWLERSRHQSTPIMVAGRLVFCTPFGEVIALDPGTGEVRWRHDAELDPATRPSERFVCRGVAQWQDPLADEDSPCQLRVFHGTADGRLFAIDGRTGERCEHFGEGGQLVIDREANAQYPGLLVVSSAPAIFDDLVITGSAIGDNPRERPPRGKVRAYSTRDGTLRWAFDPLAADPVHGEPEVVNAGAGNVWSTISVDSERRLIYLPTSAPSPDFFGGNRPGDNRHANSLVVLDGDSGEVVWAFQTVHHDLWDYDVPSQPNLVRLRREGRERDAVIQPTKTGFLFVFDRATGEPLFPIEERPVPQGAVPGEWLSPTQPFPLAPPPLVPQRIAADDAWGLTPLDRAACRRQIESLRNEGMFTPPSEQGTLVIPFTGGGANWGGGAWDPERRWLVINTSRMLHRIRLIPLTEVAAKRATGVEASPQHDSPWGMVREPILSPLGLPCNPPPWGTLAAVDMEAGEIVWEVPLGTPEDMTPLPIRWRSGTPNLGGPLITASGLVFIGAAMDNYLRAFDLDTGRELWKGRLPAGAQATPMSYVHDGRQYVVIASGGHSDLETRPGDYLVAFALP